MNAGTPMEIIIVQIYTVVSLLLAAFDLAIAWKCFSRKSETARWLGRTVLWAVSVDLTYFASIFSRNYLTASIMTSAYFVSIDWMLVSLASFIVAFTGQGKGRLGILFGKFIRIFAGVETLIFAVNPWKEIAATYVVTGRSFAGFRFQMLPLYQVHLIFTYVMVAYTLAILFLRLRRTPRQYSGQYSFVLSGILAIVGINAAFLYLPRDSLFAMIDYSICAYSVVIMMLYWNCFHYSRHQMLRGLSVTVFENIGQGIVLFDYEGNLVMKNDRAETLLPTVTFTEKMPAPAFLAQCGIPAKIHSLPHPYSMLCYIADVTREHAIRCDFRPLTDKHDKRIGSLYVFTDAELETDLLTGFHKWGSFKRLAKENKSEAHRMAAAVFDINALAVVNSSAGMEEGDRQIRELADCMRRHYQEGAYYVRGHDALLIVICNDADEREMLEKAAAVEAEFSGNLEYGVSSSGEKDADTLLVISEATHALQVKKLMDQKSQNSQILTSLVRALKECDSDTEAHVKRTQKLGEALGQRIGLTDGERSNLRLLCLLHDIGKIGIPLDILNKPGKLTKEEWAVLRSHVEKGYQIAMSSDKLSGIADMILHHHERWDGTGYPSGLSRESIPLLSRVIAIVDSYDAMTNDRLYRKAMPVKNALMELRRGAGTQFDPYITSEFIQMLRQEQNLPELAADREKTDPVPGDLPDEPVQGSTEVLTVFPVHFSKYYLDENEFIVDVDATFAEITGYTAEDVRARHMSQIDLVPAEERTDYIAMVASCLSRSSTVYLEHKLQRKDGSGIYVFCYAEKVFDATVKAARTKIVISDSSSTYSMRLMAKMESDRAQQQRKYWEDTYRRDSLTGLLTHAAFRSDVEEKLLAGDCRVVMMSIDVDHFKAYNDTYGHVAGDELLVMLANVLKSVCGERDLVCRLGGDEFAAASFVPADLPEKTIMRNVRKIYDKVVMTLQTNQCRANISLGCAISGEDCNTFKQLYTKADEAMYSVKENGRGKMAFAAKE